MVLAPFPFTANPNVIRHTLGHNEKSRCTDNLFLAADARRPLEHARVRIFQVGRLYTAELCIRISSSEDQPGKEIVAAEVFGGQHSALVWAHDLILYAGSLLDDPHRMNFLQFNSRVFIRPL